MPCIEWMGRAARVGVLAAVAGCSTSPPPAPPSPAARAPAPTASHGSGTVSSAASEKAYRVDGARALYAAYAASIYKGKLPPMLYAIVVVETEIDARGNVRAVRFLRTPSHAPEVTARVRDMIYKAAPLPAPGRLGTVKYVETWLVDKSGKFQLDTLTEGQLDG